MKQMNITNGQCFNDWFVKTAGKSAIAFNEAMCSGTIQGKPMDETFIAHRAQVHHVSVSEYREKCADLIKAMDHLDEVDEITLWFGNDMFCQMNLLTLLSMLEERGFQKTVQTVIFDENAPWDEALTQTPKRLELSGYAALYQKVLVERECVSCEDEVMKRAIELYFDVQDENGRLMQLIKKNRTLSEKELLLLVLEQSKEEGLGDTQILEMIRKVREKEMKRALFVIDYQNDFVDGALGFAGAEKLDEKIAAKVLEYGEGNVWFTRDTHYDNYLETREGRNLPVVHCIKDTHGWQVYGKTAKALSDVKAKAIDKLVFGMDVTDAKTQEVLPEKLDEIELVGLVSNICVVSNAAVLQARYPEASLIVDASCTDSFDKALHEKVLDVLEGLQVKVIHR